MGLISRVSSRTYRKHLTRVKWHQPQSRSRQEQPLGQLRNRFVQTILEVLDQTVLKEEQPPRVAPRCRRRQNQLHFEKFQHHQSFYRLKNVIPFFYKSFSAKIVFGSSFTST